GAHTADTTGGTPGAAFRAPRRFNRRLAGRECAAANTTGAPGRLPSTCAANDRRSTGRLGISTRRRSGTFLRVGGFRRWRIAWRLVAAALHVGLVLHRFFLDHRDFRVVPAAADLVFGARNRVDLLVENALYQRAGSGADRAGDQSTADRKRSTDVRRHLDRLVPVLVLQAHAAFQQHV